MSHAVKQIASKFSFHSKESYAQKSRHVYRALLRETTYLSDQTCQKYIKKYVRRRFSNTAHQNHHLIRRLEKSQQDVERDEIRWELSTSLKKAYKGLYQLTRANEGELRPLAKVLRLTYGRNGPRRHELLRTLLAPDVDFTNHPNQPTPLFVDKPTTLKEHFHSVSIPSALTQPTKFNGDTIVYEISTRYSRLAAIAHSQAQQGIDSNRPKLPKRISIPAKNTWGRAMPRKRVKNLVAAKWARFLDAVLAPLPEFEWEELKEKATGKSPLKVLIPRRARPNGWVPELSASDLEKLVHIQDMPDLDEPNVKSSGYWSKRDAWLQDGDAVDEAYETVLEDELGIQPLNKHLAGKERGHKITPRLMKRLYMMIWKECPMLVPAGEDERGMRWKVVWGSEESTLNAYRSDNVAKADKLFGSQSGGLLSEGSSAVK